jgi:hypothetical protein
VESGDTDLRGFVLSAIALDAGEATVAAFQPLHGARRISCAAFFVRFLGEDFLPRRRNSSAGSYFFPYSVAFWESRINLFFICLLMKPPPTERDLDSGLMHEDRPRDDACLLALEWRIARRIRFSSCRASAIRLQDRVGLREQGIAFLRMLFPIHVAAVILSILFFSIRGIEGEESTSNRPFWIGETSLVLFIICASIYTLILEGSFPRSRGRGGRVMKAPWKT